MKVSSQNKIIVANLFFLRYDVVMRTEDQIIEEASSLAESMGWFGSPWQARGINSQIDALLDEAKASRSPVSESELSEMDLLEENMAEYAEEGR